MGEEPISSNLKHHPTKETEIRLRFVGSQPKKNRVLCLKELRFLAAVDPSAQGCSLSVGPALGGVHKAKTQES